MRLLRRGLQVVALVGTLLVGIVAVALIVSQTPWFRDWVRRYVVRESKQYLNGELSIGSIGGNLLFGVQVSDIAVDVSGKRVVAAKNVEVDYSIVEIISKGIVLNEIKLVEPTIRMERDAEGWNLGRLVKAREKEADREGPGRPIALESIEVTDAQLVIEDHVGTSGYRLPERIHDLDLKASYEYAPVHYSVVVDRVSLTTTSPQLALTELSGKIAVRDDNLYVEDLAIRTGESSLDVDGVIENYLETPVVKLTTSGGISLPEIGRVVSAASGYDLRPQFTVRATGPAEQLQLDLDLRSEAGTIRGALVADVQGPDLGARGGVDVQRLDLAPLLKDPGQRSDITGRAEIDLRVAGAPAESPITDRVDGTFRFTGPSVTAAGYRASNVKVTGSFEESRINIDGSAAAYGGRATAKGFLTPPAKGRAFAFELRGTADGVDLRGLPASTGAPELETNLSVSEYQIRGRGGAISGSATLNESAVEGATVAAGSAATFDVNPRGIEYAARGSIASLNLPRIGRAMNIAALDKPAYDGTLNGDFDVKGSVPRTRRPATARAAAQNDMTLEATGTLRDSTIMGGRIPQLGYKASLAGGGLTASANGRFEDFNPATLANRTDLEGSVSGTVDATATVADISAPVTAESIEAAGNVTLETSEVGGLRIDTAQVDARYAARIADVARLALRGPAVNVEANGRVALDRTSTSDLKYHVEAIDVPALARLAGQKDVTGSATIDGTITGNAASLQTTGTLDGSKLGYGENNALDLDTKYTVTVPELTFKDAKVEADTTAAFVKAGGLEIKTLTAQTTYAGDRLTFATRAQEEARELEASGEVILHADHQEVHLPDLVVRTQGVEWRTAPGSEAAIRYGQDRLDLENVRLVSGEQSIDASGTLALKGETPAGDLKIRAANVDLQQLETMLLMERGIGGRLTADATVSGTAQAPVVDGHVEIADGTFQNYRYQSLKADVDYSGTRVALDATLQQSPAEAFTAKGSLPMSLFKESERGGHVEATPEDAVDLHLKSTAIDLGFVQGFTTQVTNVSGTIEADVRVTGSGQDPHVEGFVDIKNGAFGVPLGGTSYTGLNTRIELTPEQVRLQKFSILDEEGAPLSVAGELAVHARQVGAVNISIDADNFELIDNELGDVGVETKLTVTGEMRRPVIQGSVRLEAARLEVDRILQLFYDPYAIEELPPVTSAEQSAEGTGSAVMATSAALRRAESYAAVPGTKAQAEEGDVPAPSGAFAPVTLDLRLTIPDNLVLRGKSLRPGGPTGAALGDVNITVGGDLQVVKPAGGQLLLLGTVETIRGTYEFQGRRFDLERGGTLRFLGEPQPNPSLDIVATRAIPDTGVTARVQVRGTAKAPQLELSSTPPLEESDILALIVFNRPVNELGSGERASLAATAGGIATGFIAAPLGESIGRALDLDLFEITTTTEQGDLGAGLTLGQQVGDRAFFKLRQQFGERSITEFLLEYSLTDFLRVQTTAAPETSGSANRIGQRRIERGGIDLIFFFSY